MSRQCPALRRPGAHCSSRDKAPPQHRRDNLLAVDIAPCLATASASGEEGRLPSLQNGLSNQTEQRRLPNSAIRDGRTRTASSLNQPCSTCAKTPSGQRSHRYRRYHSEQLSNHLARVNVPGKHLVNQTGHTSPSPCSPIYGTPRLRATWRHWQPSMRSTLSSHLFVPRDIRSSASRFFRWASGSAWRYFCVVWIWW